MLREMADAFIAENADKGNVTIEIGVQSESSAKDTVLADPEAAADVFAFADDQLNELVAAGALQEILLNPEEVKSRNLAGSVEAATMNDKLYAYPMTADNGYFLYYDKSVLSEDDVKSMDALLAKADASGKKFMMSVNDAWYIYSFYAGAGLKATLADDGINTVCNWNEDPRCRCHAGNSGYERPVRLQVRRGCRHRFRHQGRQLLRRHLWHMERQNRAGYLGR